MPDCSRRHEKRDQTLSAKLQNSEIRQTSSAISLTSGNVPSGRGKVARTGTTRTADSSHYGSEHSDLIGVFPLSWSHYVKLMSVEKPHARAFYEAEAIRGGWSVRQLDRQISTQFFERTSQSKRREAMLARGQKAKPEDAVSVQGEIRDTDLLKYLNLETSTRSEGGRGVVRHLEWFLPGLRGRFHVCCRQKRIRIGDVVWHRPAAVHAACGAWW